jgi:hypothetical protein
MLCAFAQASKSPLVTGMPKTWARTLFSGEYSGGVFSHTRWNQEAWRASPARVCTFGGSPNVSSSKFMCFTDVKFNVQGQRSWQNVT